MKSETKGSKRQQKLQSTDVELDKIKLFKDEFDRLRSGGQFDGAQLLELFAFDVDEQGNSKLVNILEMVSHFQRLAKQFYDLQTAPGGLSFLKLQEAWHTDQIPGKYGAYFGDLTDALLFIITRAAKDDVTAQHQLEAFNRIAFPSEYDLGKEEIEKLANQQPQASSQLQVGRKLLFLMNRISFIVSSKLDGEFLSPDTYVVCKQEIDGRGYKVCGDDLIARVKNYKEWNPKTTLRKLTVSIYADQLGEEDKSGNRAIEERMLSASLSQEIRRQEGPNRDSSPRTILGISRSRTQWLPLHLSKLPLKPKRNKKKK